MSFGKAPFSPINIPSTREALGSDIRLSIFFVNKDFVFIRKETTKDPEPSCLSKTFGRTITYLIESFLRYER